MAQPMGEVDEWLSDMADQPKSIVALASWKSPIVSACADLGISEKTAKEAFEGIKVKEVGTSQQYPGIQQPQPLEL